MNTTVDFDQDTHWILLAKLRPISSLHDELQKKVSGHIIWFLKY